MAQLFQWVMNFKLELFDFKVSFAITMKSKRNFYKCSFLLFDSFSSRVGLCVWWKTVNLNWHFQKLFSGDLLFILGSTTLNLEGSWKNRDENISKWNDDKITFRACRFIGLNLYLHPNPHQVICFTSLHWSSQLLLYLLRPYFATTALLRYFLHLLLYSL